MGEEGGKALTQPTYLLSFELWFSYRLQYMNVMHFTYAKTKSAVVSVQVL